ncbi:MAG: hypothetical protein J1F32_07005 [Erysipelotrichales bacterium]|nr:hypothetical protein [Erysipelotrichales bacterium]
MKKTTLLLTTIASLFILGACSSAKSSAGNSLSSTEISSGNSESLPSNIESSNNGSVTPEKSNFDKVLDAISNYNIEFTNGYDYSLIQYLGKDIVNSNSISLRADFSNDVRAEKIETSKRLNEYGKGEQYTETEVITYFFNNTVGEYKDNKWVWSNCKKSDFFATSISNIKIEKEYLTSIKENNGTNFTISADVLDEKVNSFFNVDTISINSVSLKIEVSSDFNKLESIELSYFSSNTRFEMSYEAFYGNVSIDIPTSEFNK